MMHNSTFNSSGHNDADDVNKRRTIYRVIKLFVCDNKHYAIIAIIFTYLFRIVHNHATKMMMISEPL